MIVLPQIYYIIVAELELMVAFYVYRKCYLLHIQVLFSESHWKKIGPTDMF